jgi:hypothetical protein
MSSELALLTELGRLVRTGPNIRGDNRGISSAVAQGRRVGGLKSDDRTKLEVREGRCPCAACAYNAGCCLVQKVCLFIFLRLRGVLS